VWKELTARNRLRQPGLPRSTSDRALLRETSPDAIVHFASSGPAYSMRSTAASATPSTTRSCDHNVLVAIVASGLDIALVHLGTMGVYATAVRLRAHPEATSR